MNKKKEKLSALKVATYLSLQMADDSFTALSFQIVDLQNYAKRKCGPQFLKKVADIFVRQRMRSSFYKRYSIESKFEKLIYYPTIRVFSTEGSVIITDDMALLAGALLNSYESFSLRAYDDIRSSSTEMRYAKHCFRQIQPSKKH
jgi:hypothetical protein